MHERESAVIKSKYAEAFQLRHGEAKLREASPLPLWLARPTCLRERETVAISLLRFRVYDDEYYITYLLRDDP